MPRTRTPRAGPADHRTRNAAARRARTRAALLESAVLVFARCGVEASVIDEVIATAGVARGTFYNYFTGNDDLLAAVAAEVGDQMLAIVDPAVLAQDDAAARVANGVRLVLALVRAHPRFAAFLARVGPRAIGPGSHTARSVSRDLALGIAQGRFDPIPPRLGFDLVVGPVFGAFQAMSSGPLPDGYETGLARAILLALGVTRASAQRCATRALAAPAVPSSSLLARAEARARSGKRGARK